MPRLLPLTVLAILLVPATALAVPADWVGRWRSDLAFAADTLPRVHPNLFHSIPRAEFRREIDSLSARVPNLDHDEITVELARIVARVGDGHTRLTLPYDSTAGFFTGHTTTAAPLVPGLAFHTLPLRLRFFADGLHVVRAAPEHRELLGGKVVALGRMSIDDAIAALRPTVQRDNDQQVRDLMPTHLVVPEILHARGVSERRDRVRVAVVTDDGVRHEADLTPMNTPTPQWVDARDPGEPTLVEARAQERHWFERLGKTPIVYARYREILDDPDETVAEFSERLLAALATGGARRLILDLRGNVGGNSFLDRPLVHGIIGSKALHEPGALFVLTDRGTFSAAMMLAADLEKHTPAVLVGEKTGGHPNSYGDSRRVRLPATGLTVRVSTLYWQTTDPRDPRDGIEPHVAIEPTFAEWRGRRDPVLDSTLALARDGSNPSGNWTGTLSIDYQRLPLDVTVTRAGAGWRATVDMAAMDVKAAPASDVKLARGELSFTLRGENSSTPFRLHIAPGGMVGTARFQGSDFAVVLRRKA